MFRTLCCAVVVSLVVLATGCAGSKKFKQHMIVTDTRFGTVDRKVRLIETTVNTKWPVIGKRWEAVEAAWKVVQAEWQETKAEWDIISPDFDDLETAQDDLEADVDELDGLVGANAEGLTAATTLAEANEKAIKELRSELKAARKELVSSLETQRELAVTWQRYIDAQLAKREADE